MIKSILYAIADIRHISKFGYRKRDCIEVLWQASKLNAQLRPYRKRYELSRKQNG